PSRSNLGRLNPDGDPDLDFNPGADNGVNTLAMQRDRKILVGGAFTNLAGSPRNFLGRLTPEGTLDGAFNPNPNSSVSSLAVQADGRIVVGGSFIFIGDQPRS